MGICNLSVGVIILKKKKKQRQTLRNSDRLSSILALYGDPPYSRSPTYGVFQGLLAQPGLHIWLQIMLGTLSSICLAGSWLIFLACK